MWNPVDNHSKLIVLNILKEIEETRRKMSQEREKINKEIDIINSIQIKFVGLKSTITETKCSLEVFNSRVEQAEERISDPAVLFRVTGLYASTFLYIPSINF